MTSRRWALAVLRDRERMFLSALMGAVEIVLSVRSIISVYLEPTRVRVFKAVIF
jgi:hypothetical protein